MPSSVGVQKPPTQTPVSQDQWGFFST